MEKTIGASAKTARPRRGLLARFARDRRGIAALEFGMVSIPFLGLLCAIFETAFVYYNHEIFDNTVQNVARQILVNQYSTSGTNPTLASWVTGPAPANSNGYTICGSLPSYFLCGNVLVAVNAYSSGTFSSVTAAGGVNENNLFTNPQTNVQLGSPGSIVVFQAFYAMPIYLSVLLASGPHGNQATNLYSHASASNSVMANPIAGGSGMVHNIYTVVVFRNEPS